MKNKDDSPLYLFESSIGSNSSTKKILDHYNIPPYFHDDLLKYVGEKDRPPYRWLLIFLIKVVDGTLEIWINYPYRPSFDFCMEYLTKWAQKVGSFSLECPKNHCIRKGFPRQ